MTDENLGTIFEAFTRFYWSVPLKFAVDKIEEWHPELKAKKLDGVLKRCNENIFWHHCCVETENLKEPELAAEHLIVLDRKDLDRFLAARIERPFFECNEEMLLKSDEEQLDIPEGHEILDFGRTELGLDEEWAFELLRNTAFAQANALCEETSWIMGLLAQERYGKIRFKTVEQVERFRILGNELYQALPNPVLKGWKPSELEKPPVLPDDLPEKDEDIPDGRETMKKTAQLLKQTFSDFIPKQKRKIGRNDPCPCGSGRKYKHCCGRNA